MRINKIHRYIEMISEENDDCTSNLYQFCVKYITFVNRSVTRNLSLSSAEKFSKFMSHLL